MRAWTIPALVLALACAAACGDYREAVAWPDEGFEPAPQVDDPPPPEGPPNVFEPEPSARAWRAVAIFDLWEADCDAPSLGARIDAISLRDTPTNVLANLATIRAGGTSGCDNIEDNPADALGPPDGETGLALAGGWLIAGFDSGFEIIATDLIEVHVLEPLSGGTYEVWLATSMDCGGEGRPTEDCMVLVGEPPGDATLELPETAF